MKRKENSLSILDRIGVALGYTALCMKFFIERRKKADVVFLGDSITHGCNLKKWYPAFSCANRGISGDTVIGLQKRLGLSLGKLSPKVIVLLIGTNDFGRGRTPTAVISSYVRLLDDIKSTAPTARLIIQSVYPTTVGSFGDMSPRNAKIRQLNDAIKKAADERDFVYADVHSLLADEKGEFAAPLTRDGLHPGKEGYRVVSEALTPIIDRELKNE